MKKNSTIVITGAAGFIGSCLTGFLNAKGYTNLILVDEFTEPAKLKNLEGKQFQVKVEREQFFDWLAEQQPAVDFIFSYRRPYRYY